MINQKRIGQGAATTTGATPIACFIAFAGGKLVQKREITVQYRHRRSITVNY